MENRSDFQKALFESISSRLPSHLSLFDEISELLNVSADSAYRRIRGDKVISLNEAEKLSQHFNVSLDNLMGIVSESVTFKSVTLDEENFTPEQMGEVRSSSSKTSKSSGVCANRTKDTKYSRVELNQIGHFE